MTATVAQEATTDTPIRTVGLLADPGLSTKLAEQVAEDRAEAAAGLALRRGLPAGQLSADVGQHDRREPQPARAAGHGATPHCERPSPASACDRASSP